MDKLDLSTKAQELRELLGEDANSPVDVFSLANQIEGLKDATQGGNMMWYVLCFLAGAWAGMLLTALMVAARDE